jgi:hypothetical protein
MRAAIGRGVGCQQCSTTTAFLPQHDIAPSWDSSILHCCYSCLMTIMLSQESLCWLMASSKGCGGVSGGRKGRISCSSHVKLLNLKFEMAISTIITFTLMRTDLSARVVSLLSMLVSRLSVLVSWSSLGRLIYWLVLVLVSSCVFWSCEFIHTSARAY